jgi:hypothetical protein
MIVICLSPVMDRFHGFLRSIMLNIHPGVYVSVDLDAGSHACGRFSNRGGMRSRAGWP